MRRCEPIAAILNIFFMHCIFTAKSLSKETKAELEGLPSVNITKEYLPDKVKSVFVAFGGSRRLFANQTKPIITCPRCCYLLGHF